MINKLARQRNDGKPLKIVGDPSILNHPNIPKPLHGVAPRAVHKVRGWWVNERRQALAAAGEYCAACGVHHSMLAYGKYKLEVHEQYHIDYQRGRTEYVGSVAICKACHTFIHCGRLYAMYMKGEITPAYFEKIMTSGLHTLKNAGLKPSWNQALIWMLYLGYSEITAYPKLKERGIEVPDSGRVMWDDWRMCVTDPATGEIHEYAPVMTEQQWLDRYGGGAERIHNTRG